jgi:hypothetical protein
MRRRRFLAASGAALIIPAHEWLLDPGPLKAAANGRPVSPEAMDELERLVRQQAAFSEEIGIDAALPGLRGTLGTVVSLIKRNSYSQAVGKRLYGTASELSRQIGWLHYEDGDLDAAHRYLVTALKAAHDSNDRPLGAYTLMLMSALAAYHGDPIHAVIMLQTAQAGGRGELAPRQEAGISAALARAHGKLGEVEAVRREADRAMKLVAEPFSEEDPSYIRWIDAGDLAGANGRAFLFANAPQDARRYLESAIANMSASVPRDRAIYSFCLASTALRTGEVEHACAVAQQGTDILDRLGGARVTSFARDFATSLGAYRANPTAAAYLDRNHDLLVAT